MHTKDDLLRMMRHETARVLSEANMVPSDAMPDPRDAELTALRAQLEAARKEVQEAHLETLSAFGENEGMGVQLRAARAGIVRLSQMLREMQVWVTGHEERTREYAKKDRERIAALLSEYGDE